MTLRIFLFALLICCSTKHSIAQCEIPNGSFEEFITVIDTNILSHEVTYELPAGGWVENLQNIVTRQWRGEGFFGKYEESDSHGKALLLTRSNGESGTQTTQNGGHIRFKTNCTPSKIKGRYKFSGNSLENVIDTFWVGAYMVNIKDTIPNSDLYSYSIALKKIDNWADLSEVTDDFKDFEIDLSQYVGQSVDYTVIQIVLKSGAKASLPGQAFGVLDDLQFVFDENNIPVLVNPIDDMQLAEGFVFKNIDISNMFNDEDGDELEYFVASSDTNVVKVYEKDDSIYITEVDTGSTVITITAYDGHGGTAYDQFLVNIVKPNGIEDIDETDRINIFPNPVSEVLNLSFSNEFLGSISVEIFSEVYENVGIYQFDKTGFEFNHQIKLQELAAGLYIIKVNFGNRNSFQKFIKL